MCILELVFISLGVECVGKLLVPEVTRVPTYMRGKCLRLMMELCRHRSRYGGAWGPSLKANGPTGELKSLKQSHGQDFPKWGEWGGQQ